MAFLIANPDGSSNAKVGDKVVTGGGIYEKLSDGTSKFVGALPTLTGKTNSYSELVNIFSSLGGGNVYQSSVNQNAGAKEDVQVADTSWNYDSFTGVGDDYNFSSGSSSLNMSTIIGYGIVALVGIVVLDKFMGK